MNGERRMLQNGAKCERRNHEKTKARRLHQILGPMVFQCIDHADWMRLAAKEMLARHANGRSVTHKTGFTTPNANFAECFI